MSESRDGSWEDSEDVDASKARRFDTIQEAVDAVNRGEVEIGLFAELYHDNPPGDWYVNVKLVCKPGIGIGGVLKAYRFTETPNSFGLPIFTSSYSTSAMNRPVLRRPHEEEEGGSPVDSSEVDACAERVLGWLNSVL